jgi:hypothetical protein
VQLGDSLDDGQADAKPAFGAGDATVALGEQLERVGEFVFRDADAGVPYFKGDLPALVPRGQPDAPACLGVPGGVGQQVDQNLLQPGGVYLQGQRTLRC